MQCWVARYQVLKALSCLAQSTSHKSKERFHRSYMIVDREWTAFACNTGHSMFILQEEKREYARNLCFGRKACFAHVSPICVVSPATAIASSCVLNAHLSVFRYALFYLYPRRTKSARAPPATVLLCTYEWLLCPQNLIEPIVNPLIQAPMRTIFSRAFSSHDRIHECSVAANVG